MRVSRFALALLLALSAWPWGAQGHVHAASNLFPTTELETVTVAASGQTHIHDAVTVTRTDPTEYLSTYTSSYPGSAVTDASATANGSAWRSPLRPVATA